MQAGSHPGINVAGPAPAGAGAPSSLVRTGPDRAARRARPRGLALAWRVGLACLPLLAAAGLVAHDALRQRTATVLPAVPPVDVYALFVDDTPVAVTLTEGFTRVPHVATRDAVRSDPTLWRRMHVADWDVLSDDLRRAGLEAMLARYRGVLWTPGTWDAMSAHDWDAVPPPIRALAFRHMLQYWTGYYHVGRGYGLPPALVADTAAAIVMSESWFEHRAEHVNRWGNRDMGVSQASGFARAKLEELHAAGASDVVFEDQDYFNPWHGTRFVAIWLAHLLDEVNGDLDTAIRAYHRGVRNARRGEGHDYLEAVLRRRRVYIRNQARSPAWTYLWRRDREITREAWPWLKTRRVLRPGGGMATSAWDRPHDDQPTWWHLALTPAPRASP